MGLRKPSNGRLTLLHATCLVVLAGLLASYGRQAGCRASQLSATPDSATSSSSSSCSPGQGCEPSYELLRPYIPHSFDPQAYLLFNPDLGQLSGEAARGHYLRFGFHEGRIFRRMPMLLSYRVGSGLCNQLYIHLTALAVARQLGADLLVPPALCRKTFAVSKGFLNAPAESLLDTKAMAEQWAQRGLKLTTGPHADDIRLYVVGGPLNDDGVEYTPHTRCLVVDIPRLPRLRGLADVQADILAKIRQATKPTLRGDPSRLDGLCVHLSWEVPYLALDGKRNLEALAEAARGLIFQAHVVAAARAAVEQLGPFVGLHLRIENDWPGQWQTPLQGYAEQMKATGFQPDSKLFVASGIFEYLNRTEIEESLGALKSAEVFASYTHKEQLVPEALLTGFNSEQRALVDLLVLAEAEAVVGHCMSSFSYFLWELRALRGLPRATMGFVGHPDCYNASASHYPVFHGGWRFAP
ncbi:hypothetical protein N2152v2_008741 [Parachlorella kessleri]